MWLLASSKGHGVRRRHVTSPNDRQSSLLATAPAENYFHEVVRASLLTMPSLRPLSKGPHYKVDSSRSVLDDPLYLLTFLSLVGAYPYKSD
jgi:hypothetical protein